MRSRTKVTVGQSSKHGVTALQRAASDVIGSVASQERISSDNERPRSHSVAALTKADSVPMIGSVVEEVAPAEPQHRKGLFGFGVVPENLFG